MAVISTFDQWRKDVFFTAAEDVQESADTMESVYRFWVQERCDGSEPEFLDELRRELHITLGTAKWQLEEFEKAVSLSHENYPSENSTVMRRREFISAIRNKISHVEKAINDSLLEDGKQPFRWIQLDEEERDDFEMFLSMAPQEVQRNKEKVSNCASVRGFKETVTINKDAKETVTINKDAKYVVEVAAREHFGNQGEVKMIEDSSNGERRASSPDWRIVIADEEDADEKLVEARPETHNRASSFFGFLRRAGSSAKLKWFRNSLKVKSGEHIQSRRGFLNYLDLKRISLFSQGINGLSERSRNCFSSCKENRKSFSTRQIGRVSGFQQHFQGSQTDKRSIRVTLLLVLTVFLIVPLVLYST